MAYPRQLGIAPAVAVAIIGEVGKLFDGLFGGGEYDGHTAIAQRTQAILADPEGAQHGDPRTNPAAAAYMNLRCWAGDQSVLALYRQVSGDPATQGCGCAPTHGCLAASQLALFRIQDAMGVPRSTVDRVAPAPPPANTGTVYTQLPGGISVGTRVPASTITSSSIAGVPILVWVGGGLLLAFAMGQKGRR